MSPQDITKIVAKYRRAQVALELTALDLAELGELLQPALAELSKPPEQKPEEK